MKDELCRAFCDNLIVERVPAGLAVTTGFRGVSGEPLMFYIIGPDAAGAWRLQDDGTTIPYIEAAGADLGNGARADTFQTLLRDYEATYDEQSGELSIEALREEIVATAALRFIALLLRVQELLQTTREKAEAVWVEEARKSLERAVAGRARIEYETSVEPDLNEWPADVVLRAAKRPPVALFFGTSPTKAYEALLLNSTARYQLRKKVIVVLLLENDRALTQKLRQRADNSIVVPRFRGAEWDAVGRIAEETLGERPQVH
ncbi:DUF1828 domain-containing protein [Neoroseomonas rubea]|uniref:DUF1828 domain-containing protein n=1 Tax=Neoroseomonas rubea TaxID=2748666 RepID=UPI0018DFB501|nr:DUF1828 domain-containing protein [Roseomonas rubea]